jgi:hypothetical protein
MTNPYAVILAVLGLAVLGLSLISPVSSWIIPHFTRTLKPPKTLEEARKRVKKLEVSFRVMELVENFDLWKIVPRTTQGGNTLYTLHHPLGNTLWYDFRNLTWKLLPECTISYFESEVRYIETILSVIANQKLKLLLRLTQQKRI